MHNTAIFFDFDGVIHNTFAFHLEHIEKVFGIKIDPEDFRRMYDGNVYKNLVPELKNVDLDHYNKAIAEAEASLTVEDTVGRKLAAFADKHMLLLVTSGTRITIHGYLQNNDLLKYFTDEQYYEDGVTKKEKFETLFSRYDLTPERSVFVTDTLGDIREASEVGLRTIGVTFGYHDRARLEQGEPYAIADSWEELGNAIEMAFQV